MLFPTGSNSVTANVTLSQPWPKFFAVGERCFAFKQRLS
jgi:hypothetical protein